MKNILIIVTFTILGVLLGTLVKRLKNKEIKTVVIISNTIKGPVSKTIPTKEVTIKNGILTIKVDNM